MEQGGVFSPNFLVAEQEDLARRFTEPLEPGDGTVGGSAYSTGETGDHTVYLGEVAAANLRRRADILTDLDTPWSTGADRPRLKLPAAEADKHQDGTRLPGRG